MLIKFVTVGTLFARTVGLQETKHLFCLALPCFIFSLFYSKVSPSAAQRPLHQHFPLAVPPAQPQPVAASGLVPVLVVRPHRAQPVPGSDLALPIKAWGQLRQHPQGLDLEEVSGLKYLEVYVGNWREKMQHFPGIWSKMLSNIIELQLSK